MKNKSARGDTIGLSIILKICKASLNNLNWRQRICSLYRYKIDGLSFLELWRGQSCAILVMTVG
jgi:hypothetical protein